MKPETLRSTNCAFKPEGSPVLSIVPPHQDSQLQVTRRVAIVDDDAGVRVSLRTILDGSGEYVCVGAFAAAETALEALPDLKPDIVLMDIELPGMSGMECGRRLKAILPSLTLVMVSGHTDQATVQKAREAGGAGFVTKPFEFPQFMAILRFALHTRVTLSSSGHWADRWGQLTERERMIVRLIARGKGDKEIADLFHVKEHTTHKEIQLLFKELKVHSRTEAVEYLYRNEGFEEI